MNRQQYTTTDLFKGKILPDCIKNHSLFNKSVKVQKIFPSIGLPNFSEKTNIDKCLVDIRKEGSFVHNLLRVMHAIILKGKTDLELKANGLQFLATKEEREKARIRLTEIFNLSGIINEVALCIDITNKDVIAGAIQSTEGRISLRLIKDIVDQGHDNKIVFKAGKSLLSVLAILKAKLAELNVVLTDIEQTNELKIFSKENIPNKTYNIVFSSDGPDGAWDIATMSMRGIKSCMRWDGDYPRCLVGSIISKFVGIIYLTSGVSADEYPGYGVLGTKMMRRCIVRYAIDADEDTPCILIDKMYTELDKDVLELFIDAIQKRTKLKVHYSPHLYDNHRLKHLYMPSESIRREVLDRDWSYQDAPLKSKDDVNISYLSNHKEEIERDIRAFDIKLELHLTSSMEHIFGGSSSTDPDVKKTIKNIRMNTSFTAFNKELVARITSSYAPPSSEDMLSSKEFYKKYLLNVLKQRKYITGICKNNVNELVKNNTSRQFDIDAFTAFIVSSLAQFIKNELKQLIC